jgi:ABC-type Mn2+/Zn2+ transport system ATPase subunit
MSDEAGSPALEARSVSVSLGGRLILDDVSLRVEAGEFVCLCGPNGGGKTTFLKTALGLITPASGSIQVLGRPPAQARSRMGYLPQRTTFDRDFPATVGELIVANLRGRWPLRVRRAERARALEILGRVGGEDLIDRPLARLSGGETQRAFLARALVTEPSLLLLDEPTAGVDAQGRAECLDLLAEIAAQPTAACLMVTHNRIAIERIAERVVYLDHRVVAAGRPREVLGGPGGAELVLGGSDHPAHSPVCDEE